MGYRSKIENRFLDRKQSPDTLQAMRYLFFSFIFLLSCNPALKSPLPTEFVGEGSVDKKYKGLLWYKIRLGGEDMKVGVRLNQPPVRTRFFLPMKWGGRNDLADRIHINGVESSRGPVAFTIDRTSGIIEIDTRDVEWIQLQYSVDLDPGDRVYPQIEKNNIFAFVPAFLIRPGSQVLDLLEDIPLEITTPADWDLVTTWNLLKVQPSQQETHRKLWSFLIAEPSQLVDAFISTGTELAIRTQGNISLVVHRDQYESSEKLANLVEAILKRYERSFGSLGPITVVVRPKRGKGYFGMGRRAGFVIELDNLSDLEDEAKILIAHEALHLWNGHSIVPQKKAAKTTRWFKEGLTEYVAIKTLGKMGLLESRAILREFAFAATSYWTNPTRNDSASKMFSQEDQYAFSYDRGLLLAFAIDTIFLKNSEFTIEDWLALLFSTREARAPGYDRHLLQKALFSFFQNSEIKDFWTRYVIQEQSLDLRAIFHAADLHFLPARVNSHARVVEIERAQAVYRRLFYEKR